MIDATGAWVVQPQFANALFFSEGLAAVQSQPYGTPGEWGFIDKSGSWVIPPRYLRAEPFSHGLAHVYLDGAQGYVNKTGKLVFSEPWQPPTYEEK